MNNKVGPELTRLVEIMRRLRAEGGCPWDREQDLRSLRPYLVEETYEVLEEMDRVSYGGPWKPLCEELGDLLFQIVFHAQLAAELGEFDMADVCRAISDKIESRHPHVFGSDRVESAPQVLQNWAKLKAEERKKKTGKEGSVLDGVPSGAPALLRAERLTEKASRIGFDWPDAKSVRAKLSEELAELEEAMASGDRDHLEHELGDVLFSVANLARFIQTPAEDALRQANVRFTRRFQEIEEGLRAQGVPFGEATLEQMEALWVRAKKREHALPPPRTRSRAHPRRMVLPAARMEETRAFFLKLAPALGWEVHAYPASGNDFLVDAYGLSLCFVPSERAGAPIGLELDAPSRPAVDALYAQLKAWEVALEGVPRETQDGYGLTFVDPEENRWSYRFGPAER